MSLGTSKEMYSFDRYEESYLLTYLGSMVSLNKKSELFSVAHDLVNLQPKLAISWYAVACYYWLSADSILTTSNSATFTSVNANPISSKLELSLKYLRKATKKEKQFAHAWILLGHVLSRLEESDQAMAAYRSACRLKPGDIEPMIYLAQELYRTSNFSLACHTFLAAKDLFGISASYNKIEVLNEFFPAVNGRASACQFY
jgi:anaphase-promoting complex subunit 6